MELETIKVMPWGEDQGEFVVINKDDFDESKHKLYEEAPKKKKQVEKE